MSASTTSSQARRIVTTLTAISISLRGGAVTHKLTLGDTRGLDISLNGLLAESGVELSSGDVIQITARSKTDSSARTYINGTAYNSDEVLNLSGDIEIHSEIVSQTYYDYRITINYV